MKLRTFGLAAAALGAVLLSGCASYGYRGGSGDYYYGRGAPATYSYGAPYGSVGYGRPGGWGVGGGVRYGYGVPYYYGRPGYYYGRPGYIHHPGYYRPPVVVHPRPPGHGRPPSQRPPHHGSGRPPWRDLEGTVRRVEHRERPQRVTSPPSAGAPRPGNVNGPSRARPGGAQAAPRPSAPARPTRAPTRPMAPRTPERVRHVQQRER